MSSDSSDDEQKVKLLREAVDHQFINDSMFSSDNQEKKDVSAKLPSLRPSKQEDQFDIFGVTPEFQAYVARRLASKLEERLKHALARDVGTNVSKTHCNNNSGIKLLKDCKYFIEIKSETDIASVNKRRRLEDDSDDDEVRFKTVSVTPEHILNKVDTIHWSNRSKAPVFRYRKTTKSGLLICTDNKNM